MKLDKAKRPVVNGDYPWADDVLERKKLGEFLTPLVNVFSVFDDLKCIGPHLTPPHKPKPEAGTTPAP